MKIAFYEIEEWEMPYLKQVLKDHELVFHTEPLDSKNVVSDVDILSVFIYSYLKPEILKLMPHVKMVTTRSMGYDHIDVNYCQKEGITVCTVPNYGGNTVAEHAFALLLALSRKLVPSIERTRRGDFSVDGLRGFDLAGKTIGVIGMGHIGSNVIRIAQGFGMKVVVYSRHPSEAEAKKLKINFLDLKELLNVSDVVTLHVPYTKETHHMINKKTLKYFKKGCILLNTARGPLIETEALIIGLDKQIFSAVGLDVLEEEIEIKEERQLLSSIHLKNCDLRTALLNHVLLGRENVLITPHNAFNSHEALKTILTTTADNVLAFIKNAPINVVGQ